MTNGSFDKATDPWQRFGPLMQLEDSHLRIIVKGGTTKRSEMLVEQRNIPLAKGRRYTLTFEISANRPVAVAVGVQQQLHPWRAVIKEDVTALPTPCTYTFTAVSDLDEKQSVVTFHLGGHADDASFTLDNISLREHNT